jgi:cell division protein FtsB
MVKTQSVQEHRSKRVSAKQILMAVVAVLLFSLLLSSVIGLMGKYLAMRKHIDALKQEKSSLEQKKASVTDMNNYIDTPDGQERIFRDKYRVLKQGEGMIVVTNEEQVSYESSNKKSGIRVFWDSILLGLGLR